MYKANKGSTTLFLNDFYSVLQKKDFDEFQSNFEGKTEMIQNSVTTPTSVYIGNNNYNKTYSR